MKFETLYKRTKTGDIQYWQIETEDQEWDIDGELCGIIRKTSGRLGTTSPIVHTENVKGKNIGRSNETSPLKQAELQAQSDWNKKKDEGYKSLQDLGIYKYSDEAIAKGINPYSYKEAGLMSFSLEYCLKQCLPQFNTDANGHVKPMLATDWKKIKKIDYPVLVQPKLDGVRCLMIIDVSYENGTYEEYMARKTAVARSTKVTFLSRSGKEYTTLRHIYKSICRPGIDEPGIYILDGEIYSDELTFQEIIQAVKKQYPNSEKLHFRAYDMIHEDSQEDRIVAHTYNLVKKINSPFVHYVPFQWAENEAEVKALHDQFVQDGYEGAMIRLSHAKYEQGCRSRSLLKVKEFNENEFEFIQWEQGQREEDLLAVCKHGAHTFRAKMKGNRAEKEQMEVVQPKKVTVKHFGWTTDGLPRFPVGKAIRDYE